MPPGVRPLFVAGLLVALAFACCLLPPLAYAQIEQELALAAAEAQARQGRARPLLFDQTLEVGLGNDRLALLIGRGGARAGRMRLWDAARQRWLIPTASPALNLAHLGRLALPDLVQPGAPANYQVESFFEPALG